MTSITPTKKAALSDGLVIAWLVGANQVEGRPRRAGVAPVVMVVVVVVLVAV